MMRSATLDCSKCGKPFDFRYPIQIDALASPQLTEEILSGRLHRHSCPVCGTEVGMWTQFAYWSDEWVAIVLAIRPGDYQDIDDMAAQIRWFLKATKPDWATLPTRARVMGRTDQLAYMLKHPEEANPYPFSDLALPHWDMQETILEELAAAYLNHGRPDLAFVVYLDLVNHVPELWRIRKVREDSELIAHAADERWAAAGQPGPAPTETFEQLWGALRGSEGNPYDFGEFEVVWCAPGPSFETDGGPDRYLSYLIPSMFIRQPTPLPFSEAVTWLLILMHSSGLRRRGFSQGLLDMQHGIIHRKLLSTWEALSNDERQGLVSLYNGLTGSNLMADLHLTDES